MVARIEELEAIEAKALADAAAAKRSRDEAIKRQARRGVARMGSFLLATAFSRMKEHAKVRSRPAAAHLRWFRW